MQRYPHKIKYAGRIFDLLRSFLPERDIGGFSHPLMGSCRKPDVFICPIPRKGLDAKVKFQFIRLVPFSEVLFGMGNQKAADGLRGI